MRGKGPWPLVVAWIALLSATAVIAVLLHQAWDAPRHHDDVSALEGAISLAALFVTVGAVLLALPEVLEWRAEHRRYADFALHIEVSENDHMPGVTLDDISDENALPDDPMFALHGNNRTLVVRAIVEVIDRFPLQNAVVNVIVPADWGIGPLSGESERHYTYPTVTRQPRVNPSGSQGCRFTVVTADLNPKTSYGFAAKVVGSVDSARPFRIMVELSCTPPPRSDAHRFRFALIGVLADRP